MTPWLPRKETNIKYSEQNKKKYNPRNQLSESCTVTNSFFFMKYCYPNWKKTHGNVLIVEFLDLIWYNVVGVCNKTKWRNNFFFGCLGCLFLKYRRHKKHKRHKHQDINYQHVIESKYNTMPRVLISIIFFFLFGLFHSQLHIFCCTKPFVEKQ